MKTLGLLILGVAILLFAIPLLTLGTDLSTAPVLAKEKKDKDDKKEGEKDGEKEDGGSKFDDDKEDGEKKEEVPDKPVPKTYTLSDYRLQFKLEDSRFWKHDTNYTEDDTKRNIVLKMRLKRPKSDDHFDVLISAQGIGHNMQFTYPDGSKVKTDNIKTLAQKDYEADIAAWKEVKNKTKPKSIKLSRDAGKTYYYSFTGMSPGSSFPLHREKYYFKYKDKTYTISILFTTTSVKNKGIKSAVDKMMKSFKAKPKKRRRR